MAVFEWNKHMKDWYLRQTPRDQMIVLITGTLVVLGMLYALAWYPLQTRLARSERAVAGKTETLEFLRQGAATINAQAGVPRETRESDKQPYLLIDEIIRKAGVSLPDRVDPSGANGARVQFSEVSFDKLVLVLAELELYGLQVSTMNISRKNTGTVSVRFNMERG